MRGARVIGSHTARQVQRVSLARDPPASASYCTCLAIGASSRRFVCFDLPAKDVGQTFDFMKHERVSERGLRT